MLPFIWNSRKDKHSDTTVVARGWRWKTTKGQKEIFGGDTTILYLDHMCFQNLQNSKRVRFTVCKLYLYNLISAVIDSYCSEIKD